MISLNQVGAQLNILVPAGSVITYAGPTAPSGWLLCNGGLYNRSGTYAALYAILGTRYGYTSSSNFRVPDIRGRVVAGYGNTDVLSESGTLGNTTGSQTVALNSSHVPSWYIQTSTANDNADADGAGGGYGLADKNARLYPTYTQNGGAHENTQPTIILNYIIKY